MAVSMNRVIIAGNLARDPELKYTNSGKAVANFTVAVNDYKGQNASFFRVVVWEKVAENCNQYLSKGSPVLVEGRLQSRSYETAQGEKRSTVEIVAQNVQFLSSGPRDNNSSSSYGRKNETELKEEVKRKVESEEEFYGAGDDDEDIPF